MKIILVKTTIIFILYFCSNVYANSEIVYINLNNIMNNSNVGKFINLQIESEEKKILESFKKTEQDFRKKEKKILESFKKTEQDFRKKEKKILNQKNIIKKDEFEKNIINLQDEVKIYNKERKEILDKLKNKKIKATKKIIEKLNPILTNYMKDNSISIILRKKDIIIGKSSLDVTVNIIELLNKEINEIEF